MSTFTRPASDYLDDYEAARAYCRARQVDYDDVMAQLTFTPQGNAGINARIFNLSVWINLDHLVDPAKARIELAVIDGDDVEVVGRTHNIFQVAAYILAVYY